MDEAFPALTSTSPIVNGRLCCTELCANQPTRYQSSVRGLSGRLRSRMQLFVDGPAGLWWRDERSKACANQGVCEVEADRPLGLRGFLRIPPAKHHAKSSPEIVLLRKLHDTDQDRPLHALWLSEVCGLSSEESEVEGASGRSNWCVGCVLGKQRLRTRRRSGYSNQKACHSVVWSLDSCIEDCRG